MSCSNVHLRLVKKFPGHPPAGAIVPSRASGVAASVIWQAPLPTARRQRPARSMGGGDGGGGDGDGWVCSLGAAVTSGVVVHAPVAAALRSRMAVAARRLPGLVRADLIMQRLLGLRKAAQTASCIPHTELRNSG